MEKQSPAAKCLLHSLSSRAESRGGVHVEWFCWWAGNATYNLGLPGIQDLWSTGTSTTSLYSGSVGRPISSVMAGVTGSQRNPIAQGFDHLLARSEVGSPFCVSNVVGSMAPSVRFHETPSPRTSTGPFCFGRWVKLGCPRRGWNCTPGWGEGVPSNCSGCQFGRQECYPRSGLSKAVCSHTQSFTWEYDYWGHSHSLA